MYAISEVEEMGKAQDLILATIKNLPAVDDDEPITFSNEDFE